MESKQLTDIEMRRYSRQIMLDELGKVGQKKLKNARVLVVGVGGTGSPVLTYLSAAGIGTIGICDNDLVVENNFQRQIIYGLSDLGKQKAIVAKQKLQNFNSINEYNIHNIFITDENADFLLKNYDIVVDCTDNIAARFVINDACKRKGIPMVFGGIYKYEGQVSVFNYNGGPDIYAIYPERINDNDLPKASSTGVLGMIPGVVGCLQANEVIKIIAGIGQVLSGKMIVFNMLFPKFEIVEF